MPRLIATVIAAVLITAAGAAPVSAARSCATFTDRDGARLHTKVLEGPDAL